MGYDVALTVGPLGYPFRACQPRHEFRWGVQYANKSSSEIASIIGVDPDDTPWTDALHHYVRKLGTLVIQPDPGWATKHDSFCVALDKLSRGYDRVVLSRGDKLYGSQFLRQVLEMPWPCQFSLEVFHSILMLDRKGISTYRGYAELCRRRSTSPRTHNWDLEMTKQPDGAEGTGHLDRSGVTHCGWHTPPWDEVDYRILWGDVDFPEGYAKAKQQVADGWFQ